MSGKGKKILIISLIFITVIIVLSLVLMLFFKGTAERMVQKVFEPSTEQGVKNGAANETPFQHIFIKIPEIVDDADNDGISDTREKELGTSTSTNDSDGDLLSDRLEVDMYKTDPLNPDTDGDGFWDGLEVAKGFNPLGEGNLE